MKNEIKEFDKKQIRVVWDENKEEWLFSIIDVIFVLVDSKDFQSARNYWKVLKKRLKDEGNETVTNCNQLKMKAADGKLRIKVTVIIITINKFGTYSGYLWARSFLY